MSEDLPTKIAELRATMIATRRALQRLDPNIHPLMIIAYASDDGTMLLDDLLLETDMSMRTAAWACVTMAQQLMSNEPDEADDGGDEGGE